MRETSDEELMQQAALHGPTPLAVLFDRHHRRLLTFFVKLGHGRSGGEDLVQETFLRMLRYATSFRSGAQFVPWMYQIARNAAADAYHARPREEAHDHDALDAFGATAPDSPERAHGAGELEARLQRALARLPRDKRELVLLSRVHQLGTEDLARLFDCTPTTLRVRLHRSLDELRAHFDALEHEPATPATHKRRTSKEDERPLTSDAKVN
ncbi:MAG: RNA polymerase sigma factor [Pseudomonadota bacterium]|nr:RNA polymerase sigma factor [Pseudomonadota bacterium]